MPSLNLSKCHDHSQMYFAYFVVVPFSACIFVNGCRIYIFYVCIYTVKDTVNVKITILYKIRSIRSRDNN